jgi:hypothetical protein
MLCEPRFLIRQSAKPEEPEKATTFVKWFDTIRGGNMIEQDSEGPT